MNTEQSQVLNEILTEAYQGRRLYQWYFYLVDDTDYNSAPRRGAKGEIQEGTKAPIPSSFTSPFVHKSLEVVAGWLENKPEYVELDSRFFAILDQKVDEHKVVLCRIGNQEGKGDNLSCVLMDASVSSLTLAGMEYGTWEELVHDLGEYTPVI